ncbi:MAG: hypothetical protein J5689_00645 [Clostridia bacterium]|nr:hypothetical protein [Clostridia bacterium]
MKKLNLKTQLILGSVIALTIFALLLTLKLTGVLASLVLFILLLVVLFALYGWFATVAIKKIIKERRKQALIKKQKEERERRLRELYEILGIDVQYNADGSIKDLYQLLGLEVKRDENGRRILLSYELIGRLPKFNEFLKEIPNVFIIKNRVKKVAKGIAEPLVLTYKPVKKQENDVEAAPKKQQVKAIKKGPAKKSAPSKVQTYIKSGKGKAAKLTKIMGSKMNVVQGNVSVKGNSSKIEIVFNTKESKPNSEEKPAAEQPKPQPKPVEPIKEPSKEPTRLKPAKVGPIRDILKERFSNMFEKKNLIEEEGLEDFLSK